jgi:hypothetical protein
MSALQSELRRAISGTLTLAAAAYLNGEHLRSAELRILAQRLRGHLERLRVKQEASNLIRRAAA